jgi:hypothetical protein
MTACLHPNQTPLTLIAWVKSQILSSVLTASSSLISATLQCDDYHDQTHCPCMIPALLNYYQYPAPQTPKGKTYHNIKSSPLSNSPLYERLDIRLGRNITFDRLTFRGRVLLCDVLCSLLCGWLIDVRDEQQCSL